MDAVISNIASFIPFIIVISIVITVHELGHYWVGRGFGAAVESFSIGFGNPIFEVSGPARHALARQLAAARRLREIRRRASGPDRHA